MTPGDKQSLWQSRPRACQGLAISLWRERTQLTKVKQFVRAVEKADDDIKLVQATRAAMEASDRRTYVDKSRLSDEDIDRQMAACEQRIADRVLAARSSR